MSVAQTNASADGETDPAPERRCLTLVYAAHAPLQVSVTPNGTAVSGMDAVGGQGAGPGRGGVINGGRTERWGRCCPTHVHKMGAKCQSNMKIWRSRSCMLGEGELETTPGTGESTAQRKCIGLNKRVLDFSGSRGTLCGPLTTHKKHV